MSVTITISRTAGCLHLRALGRLSRSLLLMLGFFAFSLGIVTAQTAPCPPNIDFENGDLSSWQCWLGRSDQGSAANGVIFANSFISGPQPTRHIIQTATTPPTLDPYGHFPVVPPGGGNYALKLGKDSPNNSAEQVRYYVHVPAGSNDYSFNFRFAVVLNDGGHDASEQPSFRIRAFDSLTGQPLPCAAQNYIASDTLKSVYGFQDSDSGFSNIFLPWTNGALPLINLAGRTVIIEITSLGCSQGGHWGYGYFDVVSCGDYRASVTYCNLDSGIVRFIGTGVKEVYDWYTSNWTYIGRGPYIDVVPPSTPDFFWGVIVNGLAGCLDTIKTDSVSDFLLQTTPAKACVKFGNSVQLNAAASGGMGSFTTSWDANPDLSSLIITNPLAIPNDTTRYFVTVSDKNGCFHRDTVEIVQAPDAGPDLSVCPLGERPAQLHVVGPPTATYTWYDLNGALAQYLDCTSCQDPKAAPVPPVYTYVVGTNLCTVTDTIVVYHDTSIYIIAPQDPLIVCRPSYINLVSQAIGLAPLQNLPCGTNDPVLCLTQDQDTATIGSGITPPAQTLNTPFHSDSIYHKYQFIIKKRDLLNAGLYSGTINALAFQTLAAVSANAVENITISLACVPFDKFPEPINNSSFITGTQVAALSSYTLSPNAWNQINFASPYSWDTTTNLLVDFCIGPMPATGAGSSDPVAVTEGSVIQKISNTINVCGGNGIVRQYAQQPVTRFMYCPSPELPFIYIWQPGTFLSDSNAQNPTAYIPRSIDYAVYSIGRNGCRLRDSLHITVPVHNLGLGPQDTFACLNQPVYLHASGGDAYQWFEMQGGNFSSAAGSLSCTDCADPVALPGNTTTYAVIYSNNIHQSNPANDNYETGCPDTLYTIVNIHPLPPVISTNRDTTIAYGKSLQLIATGASNFTWTPVGSLDDPHSPAPIATPKETTNYIVSGMDANGCVSRDTVKVVVDYRHNLLIPSGFTPNGDGRNDVFKVINANFQRLMEFRVFNRWGQEIFTTTDISDGWDGKWKGTEQPVGNYQYLIRVAYPDGNVETYKGDISLIR